MTPIEFFRDEDDVVGVGVGGCGKGGGGARDRQRGVFSLFSPAALVWRRKRERDKETALSFFPSLSSAFFLSFFLSSGYGLFLSLFHFPCFFLVIKVVVVFVVVVFVVSIVVVAVVFLLILSAMEE